MRLRPEGFDAMNVSYYSFLVVLLIVILFANSFDYNFNWLRAGLMSIAFPLI